MHPVCQWELDAGVNLKTSAAGFEPAVRRFEHVDQFLIGSLDSLLMAEPIETLHRSKNKSSTNVKSDARLKIRWFISMMTFKFENSSPSDAVFFAFREGIRGDCRPLSRATSRVFIIVKPKR
jgi:hypothetical protein